MTCFVCSAYGHKFSYNYVKCSRCGWKLRETFEDD
jgi:hypothetical protein